MNVQDAEKQRNEIRNLTANPGTRFSGTVNKGPLFQAKVYFDLTISSRIPYDFTNLWPGFQLGRQTNKRLCLIFSQHLVADRRILADCFLITS